MSNTWIALADRGLWCPDPLLLAAARLLGARLAERTEPWAREAARRLLATTPGARDALGLDALDPTARLVLARTLSGVVSDIADRARLVSAEYLDALGPRGAERVFTAHVPVGELQRLALAVAALVDGAWRWTAQDAEARPAAWLAAPREPTAR
ncbi:MAG: hypothetical protein R3F65_22220 [bacterium]